MKYRIPIVGTIGVLGGLLIAGCHSGSSGAPAAVAPAPTSQALDTSQVLVLAQQTSEVNPPIKVNGGAVTFTDTSDTTRSLPIN